MSVTVSERYLAVWRSTRSRPSGGGSMWIRGSSSSSHIARKFLGICQTGSARGIQFRNGLGPWGEFSKLYELNPWGRLWGKKKQKSTSMDVQNQIRSLKISYCVLATHLFLICPEAVFRYPIVFEVQCASGPSSQSCTSNSSFAHEQSVPLERP